MVYIQRSERERERGVYIMDNGYFARMCVYETMLRGCACVVRVSQALRLSGRVQKPIFFLTPTTTLKKSQKKKKKKSKNDS